MHINFDRGSNGQTELTEFEHGVLAPEMTNPEYWLKEDRTVYVLTTKGREAVEKLENENNRRIAKEFKERIKLAQSEVEKARESVETMRDSTRSILSRDAESAEFRKGVALLLGTDSIDNTEILYLLKKKVESEKFFSSMFEREVSKAEPVAFETPGHWQESVK